MINPLPVFYPFYPYPIMTFGTGLSMEEQIAAMNTIINQLVEQVNTLTTQVNTLRGV
jgi:hypothetical protein